jgi:hypothetical protein
MAQAVWVMWALSLVGLGSGMLALRLVRMKAISWPL